MLQDFTTVVTADGESAGKGGERTESVVDAPGFEEAGGVGSYLKTRLYFMITLGAKRARSEYRDNQDGKGREGKGRENLHLSRRVL